MTTRLVVVLLLSLVLAVALSCGVRRGDVVLLPPGFEGWVVVRYEVTGAPALSRERGKTLLQIPAFGSVSTSSGRSVGYGSDEYYLAEPDGKRTWIQSEGMGCPENEPCVQKFQYYTSPAIVTRFFVGKRQNASRYPEPEIK